MAHILQRCVRFICSFRRSWHIVALTFTATVYGSALVNVDGSRSLTSAAWQQILDNMYPDENSNAMRLSEREVVPNWDVTMQADDVTKALNAFQTFCWFKHGMDDHLPFFWSCDIQHVAADFSEEPLDPNMNCTAAFVTAHILKGDDPRCVPWGDESIPSLSLAVDPNFDEYEIHSSSPMFDPLETSLTNMEQRLAAIEAHLNIPVKARNGLEKCGAISKGCAHKRNATATLPDDFPCSCFGDSGKPFSTCRNHHWGLLQLCQPQRLAVKFVILHHMPAASRQLRHKFKLHRLVQWFLVDMTFQRIQGWNGEESGLYRAYMQLREERIMGSPWTRRTVQDGLLVLCCFASMLWFIGQALGACLFFLPRNCCALWALRSDENGPRRVAIHVFKEHLIHCLVGRPVRLNSVNHFEAFMEIIVSICMVVGVLRSIFTGGDPCTIVDCRSQAVLEGLVDQSYILFLDDDAWHGTAWLLLYITIVFASLSLIDKLRWLPSVILLCAVRIGHFLVAYGLLLCGAGFAMYMGYGPRYMQFSSLCRSCSELFFLTCGMPMGVFDGIHPFQDADSTEVAVLLALYCFPASSPSSFYYTIERQYGYTYIYWYGIMYNDASRNV